MFYGIVKVGGDLSKLVLAQVVLGAFCNNKTPYIFSFSQKTPLDPTTRGLKNGPPIIWQKMKIILDGCLIA